MEKRVELNQEMNTLSAETHKLEKVTNKNVGGFIKIRVMDQEQIQKEIERALQLHSETNLVEFKKAMGGFPKKEVRKTLSAFGNTMGGGLILCSRK